MKHKTAKLNLSLNNEKEDEKTCTVCRAFSSPERLKIMRALSKKPLNIQELAKELDLPISTVSNHVKVLEDANLIQISYQPAKKGHMKLCFKNVITVIIKCLDVADFNKSQTIRVDMPIGNYVDLNIINNGYLADAEKTIFEKDQISSMLFTPERVTAQILGFTDGNVSYNFPNHLTTHPDFDRIRISFECCSEAPYYRNDWPSDITVSLNDVELTTFTSTGDFGGRRGKFSPDMWPLNATQYGMLYILSVDKSGCSLNGQPVNQTVTIKNFTSSHQNYLKLTFSIKDDAVHRGGLNLFGSKFGDFDQDIVMEFGRTK